METLTRFAQDLRVALRRLGRTPGFTWLAILMLSLALGAHLAIVGIIHTIFSRPLPVTEPDRLFAIHETRNGDSFRSLHHTDYLEYRTQTRTFEGLAAHYSTAPLHVDLGGSTDMLNGAIVSAEYFSLLGIEPGLGRFFVPEENRVRGTHPVVVLSDAMWKNRLGGRDDILGSVVRVNNTALTVVGVAPPGFVGLDTGRPCELWMPTMMTDVGSRWCDALSDPNCRLFEMVGRLAKGQTLAAARAEMALLSRRLQAARSPLDDVERGLDVTPLTGLNSERGRSARRMVGLLLTVVTLVVVTAAANLIGLLIARGLTRRREIAVRQALGAPRQRIVSLFVLEALILTAAGSLGGLILAGWAGPLGHVAFQTRAPIEVEIGFPMMGYTALLCLAIGGAVGLVPGLQASRPSLVSALGDIAGRGARRSRLLVLFVVIQIAASFVLLHSTGLLARSLMTIAEAPSADPASIATLRLRPRLVGYGPEQGRAVVEEVQRRIESLPGVRSVGFGKFRPLWPGFQTAVSLPGETPSAETPARLTGLQPIAPRTLESLGITLLQGRDFDERDTAEAPPVLIVNKTLAENLWPRQKAVGQRLTLHETTYEVIGVAQDSEFHRLIWERAPQAFSSFWQDLQHPDARFVVRFDGEASTRLAALREIAHSVDPAVPVTELGTLEQQLRRDLSSVHIAGRLTAVTSLLALVLSAAGLSGILALAVTRRRREIGIRRALGAGHTQVMALVVRDAMVLVSLALGCGWLVARAMEPILGQFLYGVQPRDPWILAATLLWSTSIAAVAAWWPARRAARVDPIVVLRH